MIVHSRNSHLGDCIWALILLSKLEGNHAMHCNPEYHNELRELVEGLPIEIKDCENIPTESIDFWIASGRYESKGLRYESQIDIMGFVLNYLSCMKREAGYDTPILKFTDLLCSFPSIKPAFAPHKDKILIVNADPKSGQCDGYSSSEMDSLISLISERHLYVSIQNGSYSLTHIGRLASEAKLIIGCATGPLWPCLNIWNKDTPKIIMLDPQRLQYGGEGNILHAPNVSKVEEILRDKDVI